MALVNLAAPELRRATRPAWGSEGVARQRRTRRAALVIALSVGLACGSSITGTAATASAFDWAGPELARLIRFMAVLKAGMILAVAAAVAWRLGVTISPARLVGYLLAAGAMAAGPGLIWGMAHVGLGALLVHGGLLGTLLMMWRDPAVSERLSAALASRRVDLAGGDPRRPGSVDGIHAGDHLSIEAAASPDCRIQGRNSHVARIAPSGVRGGGAGHPAGSRPHL